MSVCAMPPQMVWLDGDGLQLASTRGTPENPFLYFNLCTRPWAHAWELKGFTRKIGLDLEPPQLGALNGNSM